MSVKDINALTNHLARKAQDQESSAQRRAKIKDEIEKMVRKEMMKLSEDVSSSPYISDMNTARSYMFHGSPWENDWRDSVPEQKDTPAETTNLELKKLNII